MDNFYLLKLFFWDKTHALEDLASFLVCSNKEFFINEVKEIIFYNWGSKYNGKVAILNCLQIPSHFKNQFGEFLSFLQSSNC